MIINGEKFDMFNSTTWGYFLMAGIGCYETKREAILMDDHIMEVPLFAESNRLN